MKKKNPLLKKNDSNLHINDIIYMVYMEYVVKVGKHQYVV